MKDRKIIKKKNEHLYTIRIYFILSIFLLNCEKKYTIENDTKEQVIICNDSTFYDPEFPANIKNIYACNNNNELFYSAYDSINLKTITIFNQSPLSFYINTENKLLLAATPNNLYFINLDSKTFLNKIYVPNSDNPDPYVGPDEVRLFPCHWNMNYCILVNRSIFLVNLQNMTLEKIIWDVNSFTNINWIHSISINEDYTNLYILLFFYDCWPIENDQILCGYRQALAELIIETGEFSIFYDYPKTMPPPGSKEILNTDNYILAYDYNETNFLKFTKNSKKLIDSFLLKMPQMDPPAANSNIIFEAFPFGNKTIITTNCRTFFELDPKNEILNSYMPLYYDNTNCNIFQQQKGGDHYACISRSNFGKIVNLTRKKIIKDFYFEDITTFILEEN